MKYTFRCNICNHRFDRELKLEQAINAAKNPLCPKCNGVTRKVIYASPVHYKGSGFTKSVGEKK